MSYPITLKERVFDFKPSVEHFFQIRNELLVLTGGEKPADVVDIGFKKLVIHQLSYSGLGTKSGGPLGGKKQESKYKIDCRWSPSYICDQIDYLNDLFLDYYISSDNCDCKDFSKVVDVDYKTRALLYLDPPYYVKGGDLYQHSFSEADHQRLAEMLKNTKHLWVLSYDDCPEVREMYKGWADWEPISATYSITTARQKTELLIYSKGKESDGRQLQTTSSIAEVHEH